MKIICGPKWDQRIIEISPQGNIGILMSGGIDSWVLYNLLTKICEVTIFNIDGAPAHPYNVYTTIERLTNRKDIIRIKEDTKSEHYNGGKYINRTYQGIEYPEYIKENYDVDQIYGGNNRIPNEAHFPEFLNMPDGPWRFDHPYIVLPFMHLYKYHIIDIANQYNISITDTQSCLTLPEGEGHCGDCFNCKEIKWAKQQLCK